MAISGGVPTSRVSRRLVIAAFSGLRCRSQTQMEIIRLLSRPSERLTAFVVVAARPQSRSEQMTSILNNRPFREKPEASPIGNSMHPIMIPFAIRQKLETLFVERQKKDNRTLADAHFNSVQSPGGRI
jgi:hypothetical protein